MHIPEMDKLLWLMSDIAQILLLAILFLRRLQRVFPVLSAFLVWQLVSDLLLFIALHRNFQFYSHHFLQLYYVFGIFSYLLEMAILLEIAAHVLSPARKLLPVWILYGLMAIMLVFALCSFSIAAWLNPKPFAGLRTFLVLDTSAAIMCLVTFLVIAGFSQILGLSWKNHVLQLATGLAFFSLVSLVVELAQSELTRGPLYAARFQIWSQIQVAGYLCTLYFWCYAFLKKEAPRKEFSPQMAKFLVSISGTAQRQRAVLARTRDH